MSDWRQVTIGHLVTLQRGIDLPDSARLLGSVPIMGSFGITGWHDKPACQGPGVTVGRSGASIGTVSFVEQDYWPLNTCLYVKDFHGNNPRFAFYFLKTVDLKALNSGSAQPSLNRNFVHPVPILLPPRHEQDAIAAILGALDDKIDLNRRMNETLEAMARAIFKDWFVDFGPTRAKMEGRPPYLAPDLWALFPDRLDEEGKPEGWAETPFAEVVEVIGGGTPRTSEPAYWDGDIPWFSVVDAPTGKDVWVIDTAKHITAAGVSSCSTQILPIGTTILSARGTVGKIALVGAPMAMNQSCYGLRDRHDPTGSFGYFSTQSIVETLRQRAHGSVFDTITRDTLQAVSVVVPSTEIVGAFADQVAPLLRHIRHNLQEAHTLATTRDLLLPKLMSGDARIGQALEAPEASV